MPDRPHSSIKIVAVIFGGAVAWLALLPMLPEVQNGVIALFTIAPTCTLALYWMYQNSKSWRR